MQSCSQHDTRFPKWKQIPEGIDEEIAEFLCEYEDAAEDYTLESEQKLEYLTVCLMEKRND